MKRLTLLLLLITNVAFALPTLTEKLETIRQSNQVPALGAMLITDGHITQSAMTGTRKWQDPTSALIDDQFHLGSCTKAMTATLFALYVEKGKITWSSTLKEIFPEITSMNSAYYNVSLEMLLAHRGGLTGDLIHFQNGVLAQKISDPKLNPSIGRQIVAETLLSSSPEAVPGTQFIYSNAGYIIIGRVIEKITGKSWEEAITENLFQPLGMNSCGFGPAGNPNVSPPDEPWPHLMGANGPLPIPPGPNADNPATYGPAGSVHCSMPDWGKFLTLHINGFNHLPTPILNSTSFDKLHQSYPGQAYTYGGWSLLSRDWAGGPVLAHEGSNTLNTANVWIAPLKKSALISVANIVTHLGGSTDVTNQAITELIPYLP